MATARRWVAATAASVLGIGVLATSAIGIANAMPLVESTRVAGVPPISTVPGDVKAGPASVPNAETPAPDAPADPAPAPAAPAAPAPAPQPVAPAPTTDASPSVVSLPSPVSVEG